MSLSINKRLSQRLEDCNLRSLPNATDLKDFCSNDYLGLAHNSFLAELINEQYNNFGDKPKNGSTGSRLITGNSVYAEQTEHFLASIFNTDSVLLYNSGYTANLGVLSSIPQKGDTILYDELSHASIKDGIRLSFADRFSFQHNNLEALEKKIRLAKGEVYVVVESVYSMDGDAAPLIDLAELCKKYGAFLIVDEAHSTGIYGKNGSGLVCSLGLEEKVFIRIHTFGKAIGMHGACVAASKQVINFLINFSRPFIYTTALPLHNLVSIRKAFEYLEEHPDLQDYLRNKIKLFKAKTSEIVPLINSESAIQAVIVPGNEKAKEIAQKAQLSGYNVKSILSPTVKKGHERLRICLHLFNEDNDIINLAELLNSNYL